MQEISRRKVIKAGVAGGGLLWVAPAVVSSKAFAAAGSPPPEPVGGVQGVVADASTGFPIGGALVQLDGNGPSTLTAPDGSYSFSNVSVGTHIIEASAAGYSSQASSVDVPDGATATENFGLVPISNSVSVVLSWGANPHDLDLHMSGPDPDAPGGRFHVNWRDTTPNDYVSQDVDDINGNGPETDKVSISTSNGGTFVPGDYHIWVHNYSHNYYPEDLPRGQNFAGSGGKVVINGPGGQVAGHLVSGATVDPNLDIWRVADFTLDAAGNITLGTVYQKFIAGDDFDVF